MATMKRSFCRVKGRKISYVDEGVGPVLLFGHGFLMDAEMWAPVIEKLSVRFRCVVPEVWGHGESAPLPDDLNIYTMAELAEDIGYFLDEMSITSYSMIGLSLGGLWAVPLALRRPEQLQNLVLMGVYLGENPEVQTEACLAMLQQIEDEGCIPEEVIDACVTLYFGETALGQQPELGARLRKSLRDWKSENIHTLYQIGRGLFLRPDLLDAIPTIQCPTFVISGDEDGLRTFEEAQEMVKLLPDVRWIRLSKTGHLPPLEQPEAFADLLLDALGGM